MKLILPSLHQSKSFVSLTEHSNNSLIGKLNTSSMAIKSNKHNITKMDKENDQVMIKSCLLKYLAFFVGFLAVWSLAVAYVIVKGQYVEGNRIQRSVELFNSQEKIGRVMFSVGQEVLFTVDAMVSIQLNLSYSAVSLEESLNFTWNLTDDDIRLTKEDNPPEYLTFLMEDTQTKLDNVRANLSLEKNNPLDIIKLYKNIFEFVENYFINERWIFEDDSCKLQTCETKNCLELQTYPYRTLIRGMNNRFIELAYGTIYHIGYSNKKEMDADVLSQYNYHFYSSYELIVNAFSWPSNLYEVYHKLLKDKTEEIYNLNTRLNMNKQNGRKYTKFVTDVVAYLMHMKDIFNAVQEEILGLRDTKEDSIIDQFDRPVVHEIGSNSVVVQTSIIFFFVFFLLVVVVMSMFTDAKKSSKIQYAINSKCAQIPTISKHAHDTHSMYPYATIETLY